MSRSAAHDQRNDAIREAFTKPLEYAAASPGTAEQIATTAQRLGVEHHVDDLPNTHGAKLHWVGDRTSPKVILYFHGGGFLFPVFEGHVRFLRQSIDHLKANGHDVSLAIVQYSLGPVARFPVQITQGVESLRYLLSKGYEPSNIVIGGDSAGANLTLGILSVILHGFDGVKPPRLESKLAGVLLISPWAIFSTDAASWTTNATKDIVSISTASNMTGSYIDVEDHNNYSEPALADAKWWSGIPAQQILNVYGGHEVLRDSIVELGRTLQAAGNPIQTVECEKQIHIDCVLDAGSGLDAGQMSHEIWRWLVTVF